jgi:hypothetical protein
MLKESLCKQRFHALEGLELNGIAKRVQEEHRGLLAGLAFEADVGLDDELGANGFELGSKLLPLRQIHHQTEMPHRHAVAINFAFGGFGVHRGAQMRDDLMAVKIEVHPIWAAAPFRAAEQIAIKGAGLVEISDGKGEVKRLHSALW